MGAILVFGDSITYGLGDTEGGWVQRLRKETDKKTLELGSYYYTVYNLGIDGDNTKTLSERIENEANKRRYLVDEIITIIQIGKNDTLFFKNENKNWIPSENTKENIMKVIKEAQKFSSKIVFVGLSLVDESKTNPVYWNKNLYYNNIDLRKYNNVIKQVCVKNNINFIDIMPIFEKNNYKELLIDGIHPNDKGHELIFKIIKDYLEKNKIIEF